MSFENVMEVINTLSYSQGFYGRLHNAIMELRDTDEDNYAEFVAEIEAQNFKDALDVVFYFEC